MTAVDPALVDAARAALRVGDGPGARAAVADVAPDSGEVLEVLARAAHLELDFRAAIELWEDAFARYRAENDGMGAVRVARTIAYMYASVVGDWAVCRGWMSRAERLLDGTGDTRERGWVLLNRGMFDDDRARKEELFRAALDVSRRFADTDLEFVTLAYLGASLVHADRAEEGMMILDEALAAVAGSEVDDFSVLEEIFCQLFSACEHAHDVTRADEWIRIGEAIAARRKLPAVSAFCHTHYGGLLTAAGRWPEADVALTAAVRVWGLGQRSLRGGALVRLADLRVRQGRFEEAEQLLDGRESDVDAARSVAAIHLARGNLALAREVIGRALEQIDVMSTGAAPLLALLVDVQLADGDVDEAGMTVDALAACAQGHASDYLIAVAALARGQVCLVAGTGDPQSCLREALVTFQRAQLPMELARTRLGLAQALVTEEPEVAMAEAKAALEGFERLQAAREADEAAAILRSLGAPGATRRRGDGVLSSREAEVLALLGFGLTNPEIADRLYISRKTVEHHVGHVLAKLGLRGRAEAAAHAAKTRPAGE